MMKISLLFTLVSLAASQEPAKALKSQQDGMWNAAEAKRAGLTMQAALFERKAALAAALVEMYKKTDMKKAHVQYALEKKYWAKSQSLVFAHSLDCSHLHASI